VKTIILLVLLGSLVSAQTPTTGRVAGTITDQNGAFIPGARVILTNPETGEHRIANTDTIGNYAFAFLTGGVYRLRVEADDFAPFNAEQVIVRITETTTVDASLPVPGMTIDTVTVEAGLPLIKKDSPARGEVLDAATITAVPLATRNFTQLLGLAAGVTSYLADGTVVGRNTQNVSVNGSRISQNSVQINGIDAVAASAYNISLPLANPAPESIAELKVQTSLYDATFGRTSGASVQLTTKSGSNQLRGSVYEYFRDTSLTANNPFLKASGIRRPVLNRNVFGALLGGAIKKDRAFFFFSYQTTRERNGASRLNSLSVNVLIDPRLTDDRSVAALRTTFPAITVIALNLLRARLPDGSFLIPTPQAGGRYSGSAISRFHEEQFNANLDFQTSRRNWLSAKLFFSNAPTTLARAGAINVPGFAVDQTQNHRLLSAQDIFDAGSQITNEARFGYTFVEANNFPAQPVNDSSVGIMRPTAAAAPGLPSILIGAPGVGIQFGTGALQASLAAARTTSFIDTVSLVCGGHSIRMGAEIRKYASGFTGNVATRGIITFQNFDSFLSGTTQTAQLGNGIQDRRFRSTDYNVFVQDDWKLSPSLTLNLGLRYELDLPPYETHGRFATFDPSLYRPDPGVTVGPPLSESFVRAGNGWQYNLPGVRIVSKRILKSVDPNNFAPRVGVTYSPLKSQSTVVRGGYGIFYSRPSFQNAAGASYTPPFYFVGLTAGLRARNPFANPGSEAQYPKFVPGSLLTGNSIDRNNRTPYTHQFNIGIQFERLQNYLIEFAYVGSRGRKLFRQVGINQARLVASTDDQIVNEVTGEVITTNTPANAQLRAPFQGVALGTGFLQDQTSGGSRYDSLQMSLTRRFATGLQFLISYTFAKSVDDGSGIGGGSGTTGQLNPGQVNDTNLIVGNQLEAGANRGPSDFDRRHRLVGIFVWKIPQPVFPRTRKLQALFAGWQLTGFLTAMSGLPIDIVDSGAGTFYLGLNAGGGRPSFVPGISATGYAPSGYYFDPYAFYRPIILPNLPIPSSGGGAVAGSIGTDFGDVPRNALRGPSQFNFDLSIGKRFPLTDSMNLEFRAHAFNVFNNVNFANPISNFAAVGQGIDQSTGRIRPGSAGDFGRIISTSNNPRIVELGVKLNF
jgi:hypothetical protein